MENRVIEAQCAKVMWDNEGFVRAVINPRAEITLKGVKEITEARAEVSGNRKHAMLVDIGSIRYASSEGRRFAANSEVSNITTAIALLIGSPVSKVIGNFFIGLNKPPFPVKLFNVEEEAVAWLKGFNC